MVDGNKPYICTTSPLEPCQCFFIFMLLQRAGRLTSYETIQNVCFEFGIIREPIESEDAYE